MRERRAASNWLETEFIISEGARTYSDQAGERHGEPSSSIAGLRRWIKAVAIYSRL